MATSGLYEVEGTDGAAIDGWSRVTSAESENELIFAYGELGNMTLVDVGESVSLEGRLHCLVDAVQYSGLSGADMDIDVEACLVYRSAENGGVAEYNKSAAALWQAYLENK